MFKIGSASIDLQERDFEILRGFFESRVMTAEHVATLYFRGSYEAAKKRLQKLKAVRLIAERRRRVNEPSILHLTSKAFAVLRDKGILVDYPPIAKSSFEKRARVSDLTLRHELEVMDVKAAFHSAIGKTAAFTIAEFSTWPLLYQFQAQRSGYGGVRELVKPDGFLRIEEKESDGGLSEHTFFLEVDRSNETQAPLVAKARRYLDYYVSGGFAERNHAPRAAYKDFPFRVLIVFKTAERRNNTAEELLRINPPIPTQACLATLAEVMNDPLGKIWFCPRDYHDATKGTSFDPEQQHETWGYKRQSAREDFIETNVRKCRILADAFGS